MSQILTSPIYQSDIKFRWCPTVDCRGVSNVALILTSVTGTQIDLLWHNDLGWYESELSRLPCGLHTAFIVLNDKVYDENWKCISREKQYKVDTFHIVAHKFAIELFLESNEELSFLSNTPTLRHRYLSSDHLEHAESDWQSNIINSTNVSNKYHSTPNLKCATHNNKIDQDFDKTLDAVKFLSNQVKSLGVSISLNNDSNSETHPSSRKSLFMVKKSTRSSVLQIKEDQSSNDLQIKEKTTLPINPEKVSSLCKENLFVHSLFENSPSEKNSKDESDMCHIADDRRESGIEENKLNYIMEDLIKDDQGFPSTYDISMKDLIKDDQNSPPCKLSAYEIPMKIEEKSSIPSTYTSENDFKMEHFSPVKNHPTYPPK
ncbi:unnamed protein product, partial [Meganyctiphanes norvegica]